jgi:SAM-dependent methyltransferase
MMIDQEKLETFVGKAVEDLAAGYGGVMVALGDRLGLYKGLSNAGPLTPAELARKTHCAERYVREWLNSQVAAEYIEYHPESRSYELSPEKACVLADETSPVFIPSAWNVPASMWFDLDKAEGAFRSGSGIPWGDHDRRLYCGVAAFYRNSYKASLVPEWLPALVGVVDKLERGADVADIGCGFGDSTVLMAEAFPNSRFWGYDTHADSVESARKNARTSGVDARVSFAIADAADERPQSFDLICFFDCLHDMGSPVAAARTAARALKDDGTVMLVEPFARDRVEDNVGAVGRLYYSASTTLCCAHAISENGTHVLGAQAGEKALTALFREAGFKTFRRAFETPFNLVLEARLH